MDAVMLVRPLTQTLSPRGRGDRKEKSTPKKTGVVAPGVISRHAHAGVGMSPVFL